MPKITQLEPQAHDPERVNVYIDGAFRFGASLLVVAAHRLREGDELSDDEIESVREDETVERAFNAALNLLSYRPRSAGEIRSYFRRKGAEASVAQAVIERLARSGLVDDEQFARFWVESRVQFHPRGPRAIRAELRQKGLPNEIVDEALEGLGDEAELAYSAGLKKVKSYSHLDEKEFARRMLGFLQRRGFAYSAAASATRRLAEESGASMASMEMLPAEEIEP